MKYVLTWLAWVAMVVGLTGLLHAQRQDRAERNELRRELDWTEKDRNHYKLSAEMWRETLEMMEKLYEDLKNEQENKLKI